MERGRGLLKSLDRAKRHYKPQLVPRMASDPRHHSNLLAAAIISSFKGGGSRLMQ